MAVVDQSSSALAPFFGRMYDADSHEWTPTMYWEREFGPATAMFAALVDQLPESGHHGNYGKRVVDNREIDPKTISAVKGSDAPGAIDMTRRTEVMDAMGIRRQLLFPSGPGAFGMVLATCPHERVIRKILSPELARIAEDFGLTSEQAIDIGHQFMAGHNEWAVRTAKLGPRVRPVAVLDPTSIASAITEAERLIDAGVRAMMIPADCPPDGRSPADPALDPFWRTFADRDVALLLHVAGELNFTKTMAWGDLPLFESNVTDATEIAIDPYTMSTVHFGAQNFVTTMILGGVFERHPRLRMGIAELTSHWVGPMAENLDMWVEQFSRRMSSVLSLRPSDYINRNVRVTPFHWEPVDRYIERFGLEDVYTFSSDYPHWEGGVDAAERFAARLQRLGSDIGEKFFVSNGALLLPD